MKRAMVVMAMAFTGGSVLGQYYPYWPIGEATSGVQAKAEGLAELIRARGQYEIDHAQAVAAMNAEDQRQIERRREQFAAYDALKKQRLAEARARNIAQRESRQQRQLAMLPEPLSATEFDPQTGVIHWPSPLMEPIFEQSRVKIDELFQVWAKANQSAQTVDLNPIVTAINALRDLLRTQITSMDTMSYLQGRRFLDSLEMSARIPRSG